jgi:hypothetical protein
MGKLTRINTRRELSARRRITVELPEFLICALEHRVVEANAAPAPDEGVTLDHLVEWQLAEGLSIGEVALLERDFPGISAAVTRWFDDIGREDGT